MGMRRTQEIRVGRSRERQIVDKAIEHFTLHGFAGSTRELARRYPEITVEPDVLYVDEGRIVTSAGASAGTG